MIASKLKKINIISALKEFDIDPDIKANVLLWDQSNAQITNEMFGVIIPQYLSCNSFTIKMGLQIDPNEPALVQVRMAHTSNVQLFN